MSLGTRLKRIDRLQSARIQARLAELDNDDFALELLKQVQLTWHEIQEERVLDALSFGGQADNKWLEILKSGIREHGVPIPSRNGCWRLKPEVFEPDYKYSKYSSSELDAKSEVLWEEAIE